MGNIYATSANGMGAVAADLSTTGMAVEDHMHISQDYLMTEGVTKPIDLVVTQRGAGANMSVDVAAGTGYIRNSSYVENSVAQNKFWRFISDSVVNAVIATAHATLNRYDLVCAKFDTGTTPNGTASNVVTIVSSSVDASCKGTAASSPTIPSTPNNYLLLAVVYVGAAVSSIVNANITDYRRISAIGPVSGPEGFLIGGYIARTVASNNLTVSIKTLSGNNPSTNEPVWVRINNVMRRITAALSFTLNAGTNWFACGGAMFATLEQDYYTYLSYKASDGTIVLGASRIPWGNTYADFSGTSTNEKYFACSATPASTDIVVNIGRFNATLGATASFNWSVPATSLIIQNPCFDGRPLSFVPQVSNLTIGTGSISGSYTLFGSRHMKLKARFLYASGSAVGNDPALTFPLTLATYASLTLLGNVYCLKSAGSRYPGLIMSAGNILISTTTSTSANTPIATSGITSGIPFTWANGDIFTVDAFVELA